MKPGGTHHETEVCPLAEKVTVDVDAIRFAQVFGDESPYCGEILSLQGMLILDIF